jgi:hypothetical protein
MTIDAGLDSAGNDPGGRDAAGPNTAGRNSSGSASSGPDSAGPDPSGRTSTGHTAAGHTSGRPGGTGFSDANPRDRTAADMPDPRKLAQDWITLWQSELAAMAADREIHESWQTVTALWAGTMSTMLRGLPPDPNAHRHDGSNRRSGAADAPRAAPAAAAPDARDAEIDRLARHVAALEQRLAELARRVERSGPIGIEPAAHPPGHPKRDPKPRPGRKPRR